MKPRLFVYVVLVGLASAANAGSIDFDTAPAIPDPRGHEVFIGDVYDDQGVDFYSKSTSHPRWNHLFYNNPGWFVIGGYQTPPYFQQTAQMGMRFATPMSEVSMDLICLDPIEFWVFDEADQIISGITWIDPNFTWKTKTITAPAGRLISRIEFAGTTIGTVVGMDNLHYEPATGTGEDNPILPSSGGGGNPFVFESVPGNGNWFDPFLAEGYAYETDGNSNFTQVGLPIGLLGQDGLYTVSDGVNLDHVVDVSVTQFYTFPTAVDSFTVTGIDPLVDGEDPLAFPTFLVFDQATVAFTMTPIPEPATLSLLATALLGLLGWGRRRKR